MSYPNYPDKHREDALVRPARFQEFLREIGRFPTFDVPEAVILCFQTSLLAHVREHHPGPSGDGYLAGMLLPEDAGGRIGVYGGFCIGAPVAALPLEDLIAFGVPRVISIGTSGSLQPDLAIGDLVVCADALRDEGTSHHYPPPDDPARGVLTVEMEAAALFAVATCRGIDLAAAFAISDNLADLTWTPRFGSPETRAGLEALYRAALEALDSDASSSGGRVR